MKILENTILLHGGPRDPSAIPNATKLLIVNAVDSTIRQFFPKKHTAMCSAYAIIGANVATIVLGREYRPVAGFAVIDCGEGQFLKFTDKEAFISDEKRGSYHCWIESCPPDVADKELVDITFKHNKAYAKKRHIKWQKKASSYLWGKYCDHVVEADLNFLPSEFPEDRLWLLETTEGSEWLVRRMSAQMLEYAYLTSMVLKRLNSHPTFQSSLRLCG